MPSLRKAIARKAVKSTAKHTARGTVSKLTRDPARTTTLLGVGCLVGGVAGWLLGHTRHAGPAAGAGAA